MRRLLAPLLATLVLAAPAAAQVGDEQYSDPLAQPGQTQAPSSAGDQPTLSDTPVGGSGTGGSRRSRGGSAGGSGDRGTSGATGRSGSGSTPTGASARATQLPNTGADARVLAALGVVLLLVGIGLRLRTADERF